MLKRASKPATPTSCFEKIDLGSVGDFEVEVRRPKFGELLSDEGQRQSVWYDGDAATVCAARVETRIKSAIVGWRGMQDEQGNPIPFSWESLTSLCGEFPVAFQQIQAIADDAFRGGLTDESKKDSGGPSSELPATPSTGETVTASSTPSSTISES